jgi:hypothetical protein
MVPSATAFVCVKVERAGGTVPSIDRRSQEAAPMAGSISNSDAADRMRRHRQRRRNGLRCLTIELRETELDALISKALLQESDRDDVNAINKALYQFLDIHLRM